MSPLIDKLDHISDDKKYQQKDQDDVDIDEAENKNVMRERDQALNTRQAALDIRQGNDEKERDDDEDPLSAPPSLFLDIDL